MSDLVEILRNDASWCQSEDELRESLRSVATEIEALRRENQELRADRDEWKALATEFKGLTEEWQARVDALEAQNQKLRLSAQSIGDELGNQINRPLLEKAELRSSVIEECAKVAYSIHPPKSIGRDHGRHHMAGAQAAAKAIRALTMSGIHREQLDRPRIKPADKGEAE